MKLAIRTAKMNDRNVWMKMRADLYNDVSDTFHEAELEKVIRSPAMESFIADSDSKPVGLLEMSLRNFVDGCISSPVGYIEGIYVEPEYRNCEIGTKMVEFARQWSQDRGCTEIATDSELDEIASQRFHRKMGFKETYRIVQFRDDLQPAKNSVDSATRRREENDRPDSSQRKS